MNPWELARLAPDALGDIWSPRANVLLERDLWLAVLRFHARCGLVTHDQVLAYERTRNWVDLESIRQREMITKHDVKARIEEYNVLAGHEVIHLGMTSADVVDNTAQIRLRRSMDWLRRAYPETFGHLERLADRWPMRGIKGAVGTQQDQLDLLGDPGLVDALDHWVAKSFGFSQRLVNVGQVYPRSLDLEVVSQLLAPLARTGHPGVALLLGFQTMVAGYAGETWYEGDVSTSVTRRVALPGAVLAAGWVASGASPW